MIKVQLIPKTSRARNRIAEHGIFFELLIDNGDKILVKSLDKTWNKNSQFWTGWFTIKEVDFKIWSRI